jgi:parallel beta-helix repeat protein
MQPGDTLLLRAGTYPSFEVTKSGSNGNYLTIQSYNGEHVTVSGGSSAILLSGKSYIHINGLEVVGATGSYGAGILIKNSSNNNIVDNSSIHNNRGSQTHGIIIDNSSNNVIRNNTVYNNYEVGLKIQNASSGNQLIGNTVYDHVGDPPNSDGIALSGSTCTGNIVQNNTVYGNGDDGIDTWSSNHQTITGNISHNNGVGGDGNGFKMGGTATGGQNIITGNISYNNKRNGYDSNHSGGNTYVNNVAYGNDNVGFQDGEGKLSPCTPSSCKTTYINNIGYNNKGRNFNASEFTGVSHNNIWYMDNGNPWVSYKDSVYSTLSSFYSASGNRLDNPNAGQLSSLSANPLFQGASNGNFSLSSSSPAINTGDPGNPGHINAVGRPDIGAVESGISNGAVTPTSTPTPGSIAGNFTDYGDVAGDQVNIWDYNYVVTYFGNPYTIFDYNDVVTNFGK